MAEKKIKCKILTPEQPLFEGEADMVVVPAYDGEMGFLTGHSNLVAPLSCGECRIGEKAERRFYVEGGVVKVSSTLVEGDLQTEVILLANESFTLEGLKASKEAIQGELKEAEEMKITTDRSFEKKLLAVKAATTKLKLIEKMN